MKPRISSASLGSFTSGRASLNVLTNQCSAGGQHDVEQADHRRCHGVARNPLQWDVGQIEVHFAGLDLYRARIDFLVESARSQHASEV